MESVTGTQESNPGLRSQGLGHSEGAPLLPTGQEVASMCVCLFPLSWTRSLLYVYWSNCDQLMALRLGPLTFHCERTRKVTRLVRLRGHIRPLPSPRVYKQVIIAGKWGSFLQ